MASARTFGEKNKQTTKTGTGDVVSDSISECGY